MGLTKAFKGVDAAGVALFDASSMVAWREREKLDRMKAEDIQQAQVCLSNMCCFCFLHMLPSIKGMTWKSSNAFSFFLCTHRNIHDGEGS